MYDRAVLQPESWPNIGDTLVEHRRMSTHGSEKCRLGLLNEPYKRYPHR